LDIIAVSGFDGFYKKVNPVMTDILGWRWEELRSKPILSFVHPEDRAKTESEFDRVMYHGVPSLHFENRMRTKKGNYKWISWRAQPDPKSGLVFATGRDVTAERESLDVTGAIARLARRIESFENQNTTIMRRAGESGPHKQGSRRKPTLSDEDLEVAAGINKGRKWLKVLGGVAGTIVTILVTVFAAGKTYQKAIEDNATKSDIEALTVDRIVPRDEQ